MLQITEIRGYDFNISPYVTGPHDWRAMMVVSNIYWSGIFDMLGLSISNLFAVIVWFNQCPAALRLSVCTLPGLKSLFG
jgi:hypothetical protein